jgi:hypothetical protein
VRWVGGGFLGPFLVCNINVWVCVVSSSVFGGGVCWRGGKAYMTFIFIQAPSLLLLLLLLLLWDFGFNFYWLFSFSVLKWISECPCTNVGKCRAEISVQFLHPRGYSENPGTRNFCSSNFLVYSGS